MRTRRTQAHENVPASVCGPLCKIWCELRVRAVPHNSAKKLAHLEHGQLC
jgi:hypothetical protein